jgi:8-hydroxy-5-deazaflavin:NADPH oxidoreductase
VALVVDRDAGRDRGYVRDGGGVSLAALDAVGADNLAGKVVLDIANALDFCAGFPPSLLVQDTDSLAEQIQAAFPQARVVKSLNTMTAALMVNPGLVSGGDHSVFVSGNDADAKKIVTGLLAGLGHGDVIDLGEISTARGAEMLMPIWLRLMGALPPRCSTSRSSADPRTVSTISMSG